MLVPCCLCLLLCGVPRLSRSGEGKLERLRDDVRSDDNQSSRGKRRGPSRSDANDWWAEPIAEACLAPLFKFVVASPFWLPMRAADDDWSLKGRFPSHPYYVEDEGHMRIEGLDGFSEAAQWALKFSLEDGYDFHGINRAGLGFRLSTSTRFGLEGNFNLYSEELDGAGTDNLGIGDLNVIVRFAQSERFECRSGLGFRYLADLTDDVKGDDDFDAGFNFLYGVDFFPVRPLVISSQIDLGTLGEAFVFHGRTTFGVMLLDWELYAGYDYLRVESVDLHGPVVGLRYWF